MREAKKVVLRYGVPLLATCLVLLFALLLSPLNQRVPFALFLGAVMVSTFQGGPRMGLLTTILSAVALSLIYFVPVSSGEPESLLEYLFRLSLFVFVGVLAAYLSQQCRRAIQSLTQLDLLLSTSGEAMIFTDVEGRITFVNPLAQSLTGWRISDAIEQPLDQVFMVVHQDSREPVRNLAARTLRDGSIADLGNPLVLVAPIGKETPIAGTVAPIRDSANHLVGVAVTFRDISQTSRTEKDLRQRDEQFRALAQAAPVGLLLVDTQGRCIYANRAFEALCDCNAEQGLGQGWARFVHADDRGRIVDAWDEAIRAGKEFVAELRLQKQSGEIRWAVIRSRPALADDGKVIGHVGAIQDVSQLKQMEGSLGETAAQVQTWQQAHGRATMEHRRAEEVLQQTREDHARQLAEHVANHQQMHGALVKTHEELKGKHRQLQEQLDEHRLAQELAEEGLRNAQMDHARKLQELADSHQQKMTGLHGSHADLQKQLAERTLAHSRLEESLRQTHQDHARQLDELRQNHGGALANWRDRHDQLQRELAEKSSTLERAEESLRQSRADSDRRLQELSESKDREYQNVHGVHDDLRQQLDEQKQAHERAQSALEQAHRDFANRLDALTTDHNQARNTLLAQISDSKQAEEAIRRQKEYLDTILASSVDGIFAFDRDCRLTLWNPAMERLFSVDKNSVLGRSAFEVSSQFAHLGRQCFLQTLDGKEVLARATLFEGFFAPLRQPSTGIIGGMAIIREPIAVEPKSEVQEVAERLPARETALVAAASNGHVLTAKVAFSRWQQHDEGSWLSFN